MRFTLNTIYVAEQALKYFSIEFAVMKETKDIELAYFKDSLLCFWFSATFSSFGQIR